jgi:hypothetical protein
MTIEEHEARYTALGITTEIERAVIEQLVSIGALTSCYGPGGRCTGGCPSGQICKETIRHNCVCSNP